MDSARMQKLIDDVLGSCREEVKYDTPKKNWIALHKMILQLILIAGFNEGLHTGGKMAKGWHV